MVTRKQRKKSRRQDLAANLYSLRRVLGGMVRWLLRVLLKIGQPPNWAKAGFVLPTTIMLLLIVTLTVGSISLRTLNRTGQTIGDRQQRVIYNAATPAIDRAKAKVEFMLDASQDERLPSGIPGEKQLVGMMLNDERDLDPDAAQTFIVPRKEIPDAGGAMVDPYTFPDEERLDVNGDTLPDNAWVYPADTDGDTVNDALVAYSILYETPETPGDLRDTTDDAVEARANALQVRNGPLSVIQPDDPICQNLAGAPPIEVGWFTDAAAIRKNFQVNAYVLPILDDGAGNLTPNNNGTVAALEFQQDRQYNKGNKWGAWFRNDLEVFPGPQFNWNGAMHTEGNLIVGGDQFTAYLISSPSSCLYDRQSSEVTVAQKNVNGEEPQFTRFIGQTISGDVFGQGGAESRFHIYDVPDPITDDEAELEDDNDSVQGADPEEFSLDPVILLTADDSVPRGEIDFEANRDPDWVERLLANEQTGRIYNNDQDRPRVDDFYRADNRFGPRPRYGRDVITEPIGSPIPAGNADLLANTAVDDNLGLDGYWERRARREGMRIMVGQRLELGNAFGWARDADPLYPWTAPDPVDPTFCSTPNDRCHEAKQRRSLRDNLAAVQSLAIYHSDFAANDGDFPKLCMAITAHPGTAETITASTTFPALPGTVPLALSDRDISFFDGQGTNGWEYPAPAANATAFETAIETVPLSPLSKALRNLAHFAGDPSGGAPSFPPVQDTNVHPYPNLTMWGDFSMLRRIFDDELDAGTTYDDLSVADKTYLHTAACTVGMLANNIDSLNQYDYIANTAILTTLNAAIATASEILADGDPTNGEVEDTGARWRYYPIGGDGTVFTEADKAAGAAEFPPEAFFAALPDDQRRLAQIVHLKEQIVRDRQYGFAPDLPTCNIPAGLPEVRKLCPVQAKFPALYYIFPSESHLHNGNLPGGLPPVLGAVQTGINEPYIEDDYIVNPLNPALGVNAAIVYQVVGATADDFTGVALQPTPEVSWLLPDGPAGGPNEITIDGVPTSVSLLDKGIFNGREAMNARLLDMDMDLLRANLVSAGGDSWLPSRSLVYAFREDSTREETIVRPAAAGAACDSDAEIQTAPCLMDAVTATPTDPPLTADLLISPKAVDYYADPDRRVNGFRLVNGAELGRVGDDGRGLSLVSDAPVYIQGDFNLHQLPGCDGADACQLEEFDQQLPADGRYNVNQFYQGRTDLNINFARRGPDPNLGPDLWRPTEILSDAVTILSDNFCDGSIQDGFLTAGAEETAEVTVASVGYDATTTYDCASSVTSYLNQNRPTAFLDSDAWKRENAFDATSPIQVSQNGTLRDYQNDALEQANTDYYGFLDLNPLIEAAPTRVNAVMISGLVPSRPNQSYGGLHNFPRFIEFWENVRLNIAGAFIQLNFSNMATAPYDQEVWEPQVAPALNPTEVIEYYEPPVRAWGYDVGLQYAPIAPIAKRFSNPGSFRSEFYNEPPTDDPYMVNLRNALNPFLAP